MDGFEFIRRFRVIEREKNIIKDNRMFVIGMSANCDEETKRTVIDVGMDTFCPKPFKYEDLVSIVRKSKLSEKLNLIQDAE